MRRLVRVLDERTGAAPIARKALRYVFPDNWSFLLGEVALYSFVVLVLTGVYLTLFFEPSTQRVVYEGSVETLRGTEMSQAYRSVVEPSRSFWSNRRPQKWAPHTSQTMRRASR